MSEASQDLSPAQLAEIPPEHLTDKAVILGDPSAHTHLWRSKGTDESGSHDLICACGAEGTGYGDFAPMEGTPHA